MVRYALFTDEMALLHGWGLDSFARGNDLIPCWSGSGRSDDLHFLGFPLFRASVRRGIDLEFGVREIRRYGAEIGSAENG